MTPASVACNHAALSTLVDPGLEDFLAHFALELLAALPDALKVLVVALVEVPQVFRLTPDASVALLFSLVIIVVFQGGSVLGCF